ncbi:MAG: response regulator transcription factor [Gammaproteobacteria bacterium]
MIRLVLAEDQSMLRGALATLLSLEADMEVLAEAENGADALSLVGQHTPDVLVTDIEMPGLTGLEVAAKLNAMKSATKVLIITTFARSGYLQRARHSGVKGYLLKDTPSAELAEAVRIVARGGEAFTLDAGSNAWIGDDPLSDSQRRLLQLAEQGLTNKDIASRLNLSVGTVRNYLNEVNDILGVSNRIEAFRTARENGWL